MHAIVKKYFLTRKQFPYLTLKTALDTFAKLRILQKCCSRSLLADENKKTHKMYSRQNVVRVKVRVSKTFLKV